MKKLLTIFTPTYNREKLLPQLYNSLCKQTDKNFEWLVVDDGSQDNTESLIKKYKAENVISITYYKKQNGGKHTAMDFANEKCKTDYITCVDSDDFLTKRAVETVNNHIKEVEENKKIVGLCYVRFFQDQPFNVEIINNKVGNFYSLKHMLGNIPETFLVFKTSIAKMFKFPKIQNEKFITESVYYNQFFHDYDFLFKSDLLYCCEYQEGGYTKQGLRLFLKSPQGYLYALKQNLKYAKCIKEKVGFSARYFAWKDVLNLKDEFPNDYKIPFVYKVAGKIFAFKFKKQYKDEKTKL